MDLDAFKELTDLVRKDLKKYAGSTPLRNNPVLRAKLKNLMVIASPILPEYKAFLDDAVQMIDKVTPSSLTIHGARLLLSHVVDILKIEKATIEKTKSLRIFDSAEEKMKQANLCFERGDYPSTFHSLNTALELVLKDKLGIPGTITTINTSNLIDILAKYKIGPYLHLGEARKHVLIIDNKIKHQGYSPSKLDCINGIKAMEELIGKLRGIQLELSEDVRNTIYEGL
jgi:HEPN domain-containing protein